MPRAWTLKPSGLSATQKEFRLLFVTSTGRNSHSSRIGDYNTFVQNRAAAGHTSIRPFSTKFRGVGSTPTVHARDNTGTTYTASDKGPPIWWLNGSKTADNYQDFYDGSWDSESGKNESGNSQTTGCGTGGSGGVWTGSNNNGTTSGGTSFGGSTNTGRLGGLNCSSLNPLSSNTSAARGAAKQLYALSPVIKLLDEVTVQSVSIPSTPTNATSGYAEGETIQVRIDFGEAVSVAGTPYVVLNVGGAARRATYASGSGTRYLNFEYTVQAGDFDSNGISLCSSRLIDPGCGRISLNGGRISAQSDGLRAELDLPALGNQSDHKIDGMPNFTPNPGVGPMANPGAGEVALNWALTPPGLVRPGSFRLLFVTSSRNATSAAIADYNNHAINDAGAGHSAIRGFKNGFRVIASTETVDAKDNAGLTGTGVKIYWMGSNNRVADDYADFLDVSWDNESPTDKNGSASSARRIWTGSFDHGVKATATFGGATVSSALGTDANFGGQLQAHTGRLQSSVSYWNPIHASLSQTSVSLPLYALSQELKLPPLAIITTRAPTFVSQPRTGDIYGLGETISFRAEFSEPVSVRGVPTYLLKLDSGDVRARYISGSGTDGLVFAYTVQVDDYDEDGVSIVIPLGDSPIELDGSTIQAVADGSEVNLIADRTLRYSNSAHKIEARPPQATTASIASSPESGTTYGTGETITVTLTMREDVRVTGRPSIFVDVGGALRRADYIGPIGTATDALEFTYTVQAGDFDADGVALCASGLGCGSLQLNGGSIRGAADELEADLRLPALAAQSGHKVDGMPTPPISLPTACSAEISVPNEWALKPEGKNTGDKFRLLFVSSTKRNASSTDIADYNSFVQARAANGHADIQRYSAGFRAVGSTQTVNARANTCTQSSDTDAAVYWINGAKVADNYADLYDGSWDSDADRLESGNEHTGTFGDAFIWTGTNSDGTTDTNGYLGNDAPGVTTEDVSVGRSDISGSQLHWASVPAISWQQQTRLRHVPSVRGSRACADDHRYLDHFQPGER